MYKPGHSDLDDNIGADPGWLFLAQGGVLHATAIKYLFRPCLFIALILFPKMSCWMDKYEVHSSD